MCEFLAILSYLLYHLDFETFQSAVVLRGLLAYNAQFKKGVLSG
nr:hypothetical protein [uncultured Campylobacter sp.]